MKHVRQSLALHPAPSKCLLNMATCHLGSRNFCSSIIILRDHHRICHQNIIHYVYDCIASSNSHDNPMDWRYHFPQRR